MNLKIFFIVIISCLYLVSGDYLRNNSTYLVSSEKLSWRYAYLHCAGKKMDLIDIFNSEEENRIISMINLLPGELRTESYWTGGNDLSTENNYVWSTHNPFRYTNWRSGQPDHWFWFWHWEYEHCIALEHVGQYQWNDYACSEPLHFICRVKNYQTS